DLGHCADACNRVYLAVARADQNRRLTAHAEMRGLVHRRGERGGHSGIYRIAAAIEHAHSGVGSRFRPGRDRSMGAARWVAHRTIELPALLPKSEAKENYRQRQQLA